MNRLLSANFTRLRKSKVFWLGVIAMIGFGAFLPISNYMDEIRFREFTDYEFTNPFDNVLFGYSLAIGVLCAIFISLFLGTEYSDGTIRNKLIVGKTRASIYFSNLITNIAAALFMCLCYLGSVCAVGIPLCDKIDMEISLVLKIIAASLVMVIAFCSVCTMLSMIIQSKAIMAIISITSIFVLMFGSAIISDRLNQPKNFVYYEITDGVEKVISEPNSYYVGGTKRKVYIFLNDFLPTSQSIKFYQNSALNVEEDNKSENQTLNTDISADEDILNMIEEKESHLWTLVLYSSINIVITTAIGLFVFQKKNIK